MRIAFPLRHILLSLMLGLGMTAVQAFSFADEEAKDKAANARSAKAAGSVSVACKERLRQERVLVLVAERGNDGLMTDQGRFGRHFQSLDRRLQKQGMQTFSQEEIKQRIAQPEVDSHFRNDPEAPRSAGKQGASLILRGVINSRRAINPVLKINEVYINMAFTLLGTDGRVIAEASSRSDAYSGGDTLAMAQTLVEEQADGVVRRLLSGYCTDTKSNK